MLHLIDRLAGKWLDWRMFRAIDRQADDEFAQIKSIQMDETGMKIVMTSPAIVHLADEAAALLDEFDAKNYVEFDMMPRPDRTETKRPVRVTVQWARGESPAQKATRLEAELARFTATVDP